jgi:hypothetical protein
MTDTSISKPEYPANVPPKLIAEFEACECHFRALARLLEVNPAHVHNLLVHGKEPKDKAIREKLFLPAKVRQPLPAWAGQGAQILADLEARALPPRKRTYNRKGKRVT